jgi:hypothetical protein
VSLCIPSSSRSPDHDPHRTIYYLGYPLGRFAGLKHRQMARHVGVIITTERIRRTSDQQNQSMRPSAQGTVKHSVHNSLIRHSTTKCDSPDRRNTPRVQDRRKINFVLPVEFRTRSIRITSYPSKVNSATRLHVEIKTESIP